MADQLNMGGLALGDSQHANGVGGGRSAYIPPHLRGVSQHMPPPPSMDDPGHSGMGASAWSDNA